MYELIRTVNGSVPLLELQVRWCFFAEIDIFETIFPKDSRYTALVACGTDLVIFRSFDSVNGFHGSNRSGPCPVLCACNYSFDGRRPVMKSFYRTFNALVQVFGLVGLTFYIDYLDISYLLFFHYFHTWNASTCRKALINVWQGKQRRFLSVLNY